jgi:hypothetical protein
MTILPSMAMRFISHAKRYMRGFEGSNRAMLGVVTEKQIRA